MSASVKNTLGVKAFTFLHYLLPAQSQYYKFHDEKKILVLLLLLLLLSFPGPEDLFPLIIKHQIHEQNMDHMSIPGESDISLF